MITVQTKKQEKKNHVETVTVPVYYATAGNTYGLPEGWYEWSPDSPIEREDCGTLTIAYLPNEPYRRHLRDQALKCKRQVRRSTLSQTDIDEIDIRAVALFGLKDWNGFKDAETQSDIKYTPDVGFNAFWNDRSFLDFVCDLCRDDELFDVQGDVEQEQEQVKN